jgi:hypothetical protein
VLGLLWLLLALIAGISLILQPTTITIEWSTETEVDAAGFNVYRATSADGPYTKINEQLIPGKGSATAGATYTFVDGSVEPGTTYYYRLEDVEFDNTSLQHEPIPYEAPLIPWWMPIVVTLSLLIGLFLVIRGLRAEKKS